MFSLLAFHLHLNGVFGHLERRFLKKGPQEGDLKTPASHLCVDGRNRRFSISCIITSITHALYGMLSYFSRFSFFMWTGVNESNTLRSLSDTRGQGYRAFHLRGEHWNNNKKTFSKEQTSTPTGLSWYTIMVITSCENALLGVTIHKLVF